MGGTAEAKRQSKRATELTGLWWCMTGHHYARGEVRWHNGRKLCQHCQRKINERSARNG